MVALLQPEFLDRAAPESELAHRHPQLRLIQGGRGAVATVFPQTIVLFLGVMLVMAVLVLRLAQGTPPASSWEGLGQQAYGPSVPVLAATSSDAPGLRETVLIVQPGDTLWGLALTLAPGADPRPIVDRLAERNGGSSLQAGQRLIVPANLLP